MSVIRALRCDGPDCDIISMPWDGRVRAYQTPTQGRKRDEALHYCTEHYPYLICTVCDQRLRPYGGLKADWPGTVAKAKTNPPMCATCSAAGYDQVDTRINVSDEVARKVRAMVRSRFSGDEAQDLIHMLGLD